MEKLEKMIENFIEEKEIMGCLPFGTECPTIVYSLRYYMRVLEEYEDGKKTKRRDNKGVYSEHRLSSCVHNIARMLDLEKKKAIEDLKYTLSKIMNDGYYTIPSYEEEGIRYPEKKVVLDTSLLYFTKHNGT